MQLGTRWKSGDPAPNRLPEVVRDAVNSVDEEARAETGGTQDLWWTLTWLEGRPIAELDDGTIVTYSPESDSAVIRQADDPDADDDDDY